MTVTGWSSEEFNEAPMLDVLELLEYWGENPPVHLIELAKVGILGKRKKKNQEPKEFRELTEEEKREEEGLPKWVQEVRKKAREERRKNAG